MDEMSSTDLHSLIRLIDDPDERIYDQIREELVARGDEAIPELESAWEDSSYGLLFQQRIESIIHRIQFEKVGNGLSTWAANGGKDLLEGVLWVNRYQYPELDTEWIRGVIAQLKKDVWIELNEDLTAFEKVKVLNHVIYGIHGFQGNKKDPQAPRNHYFNLLLESGNGGPLILGILYILLARSFGIPIRGVDLPEHFVLAYLDLHGVLTQLGEDGEVLFYINPFNKGGIFDKKEIDSFLKQMKKEEDPAYYRPCGNIAIVRRLLKQLQMGYRDSGQEEKVEELGDLEERLS